MGCIVSDDVIQPYPPGPNQNPQLANRQAQNQGQFGQMQPMYGQNFSRPMGMQPPYMPMRQPYGMPMQQPYGAPMQQPYGAPMQQPYGMPMQQPYGAQPMYPPNPYGQQMQQPMYQNYNYGMQKQLPPSAFNNQFAQQSTGYFKIVNKEFPPDFSSIAGNIREIHGGAKLIEEEKQFSKFKGDSYDWRKCAQIQDVIDMGGPAFFSTQGIFPQDLKQGQLGDCWLVQSFAAIAEFPHRVKKLFKSEQANEDGSYDVFLYIDGYKQQINVQDCFLTNGENQPAFCRSLNGSTWHMFLEKAYAMHYGSYATIEGGSPSDAFTDLTGAPSDFYLTNVEDAFDKIFEGNENCFIMSASTKGTPNMKENYGLIANHAYSLIGAAKVTNYNGNQCQIVQLRNPHGQTEWNGDWSDQSDLWTYEDKQRLNVTDENDGLFWMSIKDLQKHFAHFDICKYKDDSVFCGSEPLEFEQNGDYKFISVKIPNSGNYNFTLCQEGKRGKNHASGYIVQQAKFQVVQLKNGKDFKEGVRFIGSQSRRTQRLDLEIKNLEAGNYIVIADPMIDSCYVGKPPMYLNTYGPGIVTIQDVTSQFDANDVQDYSSSQ